MQSVLRGTTAQSGLGHGTTGPQIEALEGQYWGVGWGVKNYAYP